MNELAALQQALAAEQQVVYGYGLVGAHLSARARTLALVALADHEARRDALIALVRGRGAQPTAPAPAYRPPAPVTDRSSALALAVHLEDAAAGAAWDLAAASGPGEPARRLATGWLGDAATRSAQWRVLAGSPPGPALPGQPS